MTKNWVLFSGIAMSSACGTSPNTAEVGTGDNSTVSSSVGEDGTNAASSADATSLEAGEDTQDSTLPETTEAEDGGDGDGDSDSDGGTSETEGGEECLEWERQQGSSDAETPGGLAIDSTGSVYAVGITHGDLNNNTSAGLRDIYAMKYGSDGSRLWVMQTGTSHNDSAAAVAIDTADNVYVSGDTWSNLAGVDNQGNNDAFLMRLNSEGNRIWTRQWGGTGQDSGDGVATDMNGNIYVAGRTTATLPGQESAGNADAFIVKYSSDGDQLWMRQFGSVSDDSAEAVATDSEGAVYVAGITNNALHDGAHAGGADLFVVKYAPDGSLVWTRQLGSEGGEEDEVARAVTVDNADNIYVTGHTSGSLDGGSYSGFDDIFVLKYRPDGALLWSEQIGTSSIDQGMAITTDANGEVYVAAQTKGEWGLDNPAVQTDALLLHYNSEGGGIWYEQLRPTQVNPTNQAEIPRGIVADGASKLYMGGWTASTDGDLFLLAKCLSD